MSAGTVRVPLSAVAHGRSGDKGNHANVAVIAYTATNWRRLLKRPRGWDGPVPDAGHCYRFCLSNEHVDVVLTGPATAAHPAVSRQVADRADRPTGRLDRRLDRRLAVLPQAEDEDRHAPALDQLLAQPQLPGLLQPPTVARIERDEDDAGGDLQHHARQVALARLRDMELQRHPPRGPIADQTLDLRAQQRRGRQEQDRERHWVSLPGHAPSLMSRVGG